MSKEDIKLQANLNALRRIDPLIDKIIDSTSHVALYEYTNQSWRTKNVEGTMFLFGRTSPPYYGLFVMNRKSTMNSLLPLTELSSIKLNGEYLMYRTENNEINGIWFYETEDRDRFLQQILKFYKEEKAPPTANKKNPNFLVNAQSDLNDLLSRAQQRENAPKISSSPEAVSLHGSKPRSLNKQKKASSRQQHEPKSHSERELQQQQQQQEPQQPQEKAPKPLSSDLERLFSNVKTALPLKQNHHQKTHTTNYLSTSSLNVQANATEPPASAVPVLLSHPTPPALAHPTSAVLPPLLPTSAGQDLGYPMMPLYPPPPSHYMYIPPGALLAAAQPLLAHMPPMLRRDEFRDHLIMLLQSDPPFLETMYNNYTSLASAAQQSPHQH